MKSLIGLQLMTALVYLYGTKKLHGVERKGPRVYHRIQEESQRANVGSTTNLNRVLILALHYASSSMPNRGKEWTVLTHSGCPPSDKPRGISHRVCEPLGVIAVGVFP
jgi:hypothetical protein